MLALTWSTPAGDVVRETAALTDRPFGGNLILDADQHRRLDEALEAGMRIVSLFWGDPAGYVEQVHDAGGIVLQTVGSANEGRRAADRGVDAIVAQGWEAGGHVRGQVATLPLVPAVVDAVAPVPVIAAGGIGDARGVAAVLGAGRPGGMAGYPVPARRGDAPPRGVPPPPGGRSRDRCAMVRRPVRGGLAGRAPPRSAQLDGGDVGGRRPPPVGGRPGEGVIAHFASGEAILRYEPAAPMAGTTGNVEALSLWAGQSVALAGRTQPAAEIVAELVDRGGRPTVTGGADGG